MPLAASCLHVSRWKRTRFDGRCHEKQECGGKPKAGTNLVDGLLASTLVGVLRHIVGHFRANPKKSKQCVMGVVILSSFTDIHSLDGFRVPALSLALL